MKLLICMLTICLLSGFGLAREKECPPTIYHECGRFARKGLIDLAALFHETDWEDIADDSFLTEACKGIQKVVQCAADYELDCREGGLTKSVLRDVRLVALCDAPDFNNKVKTVRLCLESMTNYTEGRRALQRCETMAARDMASVLRVTSPPGDLTYDDVDDWVCCNLPKYRNCYRTAAQEFCEDALFRAMQYTQESPAEILDGVFAYLLVIAGCSNVTASRCAEMEQRSGGITDLSSNLAKAAGSQSCDMFINVGTCLAPYLEWIRLKNAVIDQTLLWLTMKNGECQLMMDAATCLKYYHTRCLYDKFSSTYLSIPFDGMIRISEECTGPELSERLARFEACVREFPPKEAGVCNDHKQRLHRLFVELVNGNGPETAQKNMLYGEPLLKYLICCSTEVLGCYVEHSKSFECVYGFLDVKNAFQDAFGCDLEMLVKCPEDPEVFLKEFEDLLSKSGSAELDVIETQERQFNSHKEAVKRVEL